MLRISLTLCRNQGFNLSIHIIIFTTLGSVVACPDRFLTTAMEKCLESDTRKQ